MLESPASSSKHEHQEARAEDLAYVLFTSGSTDKAKTVLTSQQALAAGALHQARALGMSDHSRVLGDGPLYFARVMPKLLCSIVIGACLCTPQSSQGIVEAANQLRTDFLMLPRARPYNLVNEDIEAFPSYKYVEVKGRWYTSCICVRPTLPHRMSHRTVPSDPISSNMIQKRGNGHGVLKPCPVISTCSGMQVKLRDLIGLRHSLIGKSCEKAVLSYCAVQQNSCSLVCRCR